MKKTLDDIRSERYLNDPPGDPVITLLKLILDKLEEINCGLIQIDKRIADHERNTNVHDTKRPT